MPFMTTAGERYSPGGTVLQHGAPQGERFLDKSLWNGHRIVRREKAAATLLGELAQEGRIPVRIGAQPHHAERDLLPAHGEGKPQRAASTFDPIRLRTGHLLLTP